MTIQNLVESIGLPAGGVREKPIVAISGGFDPVHVGHVRLIKAAAEHGDVIIILNSDDWLKTKKGYSFMDWDSRAEILLNMKRVGAVVAVDDSDATVCEALRKIKPDYFANGGDRTAVNTPELAVCKELGIKMLFGIGGEKVASSQELVNAVKA